MNHDPFIQPITKKMRTGYRIAFVLVELLFFTLLASCEKYGDEGLSMKDELDAGYASQWDRPEYRAAKSADSENYLTREEKDVFYYLNLSRINPPLFARTYAAGYDGDKGWLKGYAWDERKASLIAELSEMEPLAIIEPDRELYEMALCFAYEGGRLGLGGHDRSQTGCSGGYNAECCHYGGAQNGLSIVMSLLIDAGENNSALGHRRICLGNYAKMGVAIQPHKDYKFNAVLDFKR
jgi:hypothetical protein